MVLDEQIIIIDASASMQAEYDGESAFDTAVSLIQDQIDDLDEGSDMTIIVAGATADCVISRSSSTHDLEEVIESLECEYSGEDLDGAIDLATEVLEENPGATVTYYTDKDYDENDDLNVVNVADSDSVSNIAVTSLDAEETLDDGYEFSGEITNYGSAQSVTVALYVDDELYEAQIIDMDEDETQTVTWEETDITDYDSAYIYIEADDALSCDNEYYNFNDESEETYSVEIVSEQSGFLETLLSAFDNYDVTVYTSVDDAETEGYDLYIYDGVSTDTLPEDGAVWYINPTELPSETDITLGDTVSGEAYLSEAIDTDDDLFSLLTDLVDLDDVAVSEYTSIESYGDYEVLYTVDDEPAILAATVDGVRTVVFNFDIHNSNLPLEVGFLELFNNIQDYLLPDMTDENIYQTNETIEVEGVSAVSLVTLSSTESSDSYYDVPVEYTLTDPGLYEITQTLENGSTVSDEIFVYIPSDESDLGVSGGTIDTTDWDDLENDDITYTKEIWFYLAVLLVIIIILEWEVQYREQY